MALHHFCLNGIIKDFKLYSTPSTTPRVVAVLNLACAMLSMSLFFSLSHTSNVIHLFPVLYRNHHKHLFLSVKAILIN